MSSSCTVAVTSILYEIISGCWCVGSY